MSRLKFTKGYRGNPGRLKMLEREVHRLRTERKS
jgi:hypothetical protein